MGGLFRFSIEKAERTDSLKIKCIWPSSESYIFLPKGNFSTIYKSLWNHVNCQISQAVSDNGLEKISASQELIEYLFNWFKENEIDCELKTSEYRKLKNPSTKNNKYLKEILIFPRHQTIAKELLDNEIDKILNLSLRNLP